MDYLEYKNYLCHHGIKGQKWGVRNYQNEDSTLTSEGQRRYNTNMSDYQAYKSRSQALANSSRVLARQSTKLEQEGRAGKARRVMNESEALRVKSEQADLIAQRIKADPLAGKSISQIQRRENLKVAGKTAIGVALPALLTIRKFSKAQSDSTALVPAGTKAPGGSAFKQNLLSSDPVTRRKSWGKLIVKSAIGGFIANRIANKQRKDAEEEYLKQRS